MENFCCSWVRAIKVVVIIYGRYRSIRARRAQCAQPGPCFTSRFDTTQGQFSPGPPSAPRWLPTLRTSLAKVRSTCTPSPAARASSRSPPAAGRCRDGAGTAPKFDYGVPKELFQAPGFRAQGFPLVLFMPCSAVLIRCRIAARSFTHASAGGRLSPSRSFVLRRRIDRLRRTRALKHLLHVAFPESQGPLLCGDRRVAIHSRHPQRSRARVRHRPR